MITPRFTLSQNNDSVHFCIRAPYCKLGNMEVSVEDEVFAFFCKPYYLRLHFPGKLTDEFTNTSFDCNTGELRFSVKKTNAGEHFDDIEMITKLMCPKVEVVDGDRKISVLSSSGAEVVGNTIDNEKEYGFAMLGNYNFAGLSSEFSDVLEVDPIEVGLSERKKLRLQLEQGKFDMDHYIADLFDSEVIDELMKLESPWSKLTSTGGVDPPSTSFTDEELDFLKDLQNVEYHLNATQVNYCHNSLVDILFAYCYDRRTTYFEGTSESGWTIVKLAASLSWLDGFKTPKEALVCAYRRSVIYPLYRHFDLCNKVFTDLKQLLSLGEQHIIKCLIDIHKIFLTGDCSRYVLNNLFVKHYIRYVMQWDKEAWKEVVNTVAAISINKEDLGLNLKLIEANASLESMMSSLKISQGDSDDSSDSSSDSDTDSSSCSCGSSGSSDTSETE